MQQSQWTKPLLINPTGVIEADLVLAEEGQIDYDVAISLRNPWTTPQFLPVLYDDWSSPWQKSSPAVSNLCSIAMVMQRARQSMYRAGFLYRVGGTNRSSNNNLVLHSMENGSSTDSCSPGRLYSHVVATDHFLCSTPSARTTYTLQSICCCS
jgi:hypothetical protein